MTKACSSIQTDAKPRWPTEAPFLPLRLGRLTCHLFSEGQKELSWAQ